jgi:hypothetical protein
MKRLLLALALTASPAFAQNAEIYTPREGGGVIQQPGNLTVVEIGLLPGMKAAPPGVTGLILEQGKPPRWTTLSPEDVDRKYGGDGTPEVRLFPEVEDKRDDKTIEIFPEDGSTVSDGRIAPNAGHWIGNNISQTFEGCPPNVAGPIRAQTATLDNARIQGDIGPSFTGNDISPDLLWTQTGPNAWIGEMDRRQGSVGMRMQWAVKVLSPATIDNRQQVNVALPNGSSCQVLSHIEYVWIQN